MQEPVQASDSAWGGGGRLGCYSWPSGVSGGVVGGAAPLFCQTSVSDTPRPLADSPADPLNDSVSELNYGGSFCVFLCIYMLVCARVA